MKLERSSYKLLQLLMEGIAIAKQKPLRCYSAYRNYLALNDPDIR